MRTARDDAPLLAVRPLSERPREEQLRQALARAAADSPQAADLRRELEGLRETSVPIMRELPPEQARVTHVFERGQLARSRRSGAARRAGALSPAARAARRRTGSPCALAGGWPQPAHRARDGESPLGAALRQRAGRNGGGFRHDRRASGAAAAARLARLPFPERLALERETRPARDRPFADLSPKLRAQPRPARADPANRFLARGARFRLPGRGDPRPGARRRRIAQRQNVRPQRHAAATGGRLAGGLQCPALGRVAR